ncbi:MAG: hypothetical protein ACD_2C00208G0001 [uncultured bacterium (gcode 4)]|uniref:HD domain-containing protein n=1 Tax=uncultured bacterium (gcode 4) TaxID=1234023 RepID=K2H0B3_9BACT|nr:MAG: hypothetical protein ACD_2C00208G0001 [uncultured bacterium (gcode 4)]
MIIQDKVYWDIIITEPVIQELIGSASMRRLKWIDAAWRFEHFYPWSSYTRFDHCLWVYHVLNIYGASLEEQIAWLIHDVSHSAFSHCVDYVLNSWSEELHDFQDNIFEEFVRKSDIPSILDKYGFSLERILDSSNFPLLENNLPNFCADRIDYSLRTWICYKYADKEYVGLFLKKLQTNWNEWYFNEPEFALRFSYDFKFMNETYWAWFETSMMMCTISDYLKYSLEKWYITENDLFLEDEEVLSKIRLWHPEDPKLAERYRRTTDINSTAIDEETYDRKIACKSRIIDPLVLNEWKIIRLSQVSSEWENVLKTELLPKTYYIKYVASPEFSL